MKGWDMTMRFFWQSAFWVCVIVLWSASAGAEIYRYVDPSGTVRFTDNLQDVPDAQRQRVTAIPEEYPSASPATPQQNTPIRSDPKLPANVQTQPTVLAEDAPASLVEQAEKLKKEQAEMDQEYLDLVREQAALAAQRPKVRDSESMTRYNGQVDSLNQKTDQYEKRRQVFQQKMEAFNQRLREHLDATDESAGPKNGTKKVAP